jgi:hypothetical protein
MREYLKKFVFFVIIIIVAAVIFRIILSKTINVRITGPVNTDTKIKF